MKAVLCFYIWWILFLFASSSSSVDDTSAEMDQSSDLKWALIAGAIGIAIGVSVFICTSDGNSEPHDNKLLRDTLNAVKHELENQKAQLHQNLQDVETKRKKNKEEVQILEKKIWRVSMQSGDLNFEATSDGQQLHKTTNEVKKESKNLTEPEKEKTVKHELETQKDQLLHKLQDVETKRKENKEEVQPVEKKITEKEKSEDKDLLLKEKEKLLQSQWKLDEEKKLYERQILNIEKVMEPIEMYMMRNEEV